jgi:hypothetical protein
MQLFQTTLGAARRDGDELVVLDGTADVLEWAMSDNVAGAPEKRFPGPQGDRVRGQ